MKKVLYYIPATAMLLGMASAAQAIDQNSQDTTSKKNTIVITLDEEEVVVELDKAVEELKTLAHAFVDAMESRESMTKSNSNNNTIIIESPSVYAESPVTIQKNKNKSKKRFKFSLLTMDVGINGFVDNSDYTSAEAMNFVRMEDASRERAFDLKNGQSRNINLWPASFNFDLSGSSKQNVYLSVGVPGFQFYSLKYNNPIQFVEGLDPHVIETTNSYKKNKLGITYLSIPLSITGQSKISKSKWLTYGAGVIGGYRIASWTNQKQAGENKEKTKDPFNLNDYQVALTGELGVKGVVRLYATYNLTNMWKNSLDQNLFAVGVRFFGI